MVEAATDQFIAVMNEWLPMLNDARASQGLAPVDHVLELFDRAERLLIAMSAAFDFAADYLPKNVMGHYLTAPTGRNRGWPPGPPDRTALACWSLSALRIKITPMRCSAP